MLENTLIFKHWLGQSTCLFGLVCFYIITVSWCFWKSYIGSGYAKKVLFPYPCQGGWPVLCTGPCSSIWMGILVNLCVYVLLSFGGFFVSFFFLFPVPYRCHNEVCHSVHARNVCSLCVHDVSKLDCVWNVYTYHGTKWFRNSTRCGVGRIYCGHDYDSVILFCK